MEKSISSKQEQPIMGEMSSEEQQVYFDELAMMTKVGSIPTMILDSNLVIRHMTESVYTFYLQVITHWKKSLFSMCSAEYLLKRRYRIFFKVYGHRKKGGHGSAIWCINRIH